MKIWWVNNKWRFWAWYWVLCDEETGFRAWQEYRHFLSPDEERGLCALIIEEYGSDVNEALKNPLLSLLLAVRRLLNV